MSGTKIFALQQYHITSAKPRYMHTDKLISSQIHTTMEKRKEEKRSHQNNWLATLRKVVGMIRRFGISFPSHTQA
jgi:hypothetical protein